MKTEPTTYAYQDLAREGRTSWTGVKNALAQIHLKAMAVGDEVFVYHTGGEKSVVGVARVERAAHPDPSDTAGKLVCVDLVALAALPAPVPLARLRAEPLLARWDLLTQSRLSVLPVPPEAWAAVMRLARPD